MLLPAAMFVYISLLYSAEMFNHSIDTLFTIPLLQIDSTILLTQTSSFQLLRHWHALLLVFRQFFEQLLWWLLPIALRIILCPPPQILTSFLQRQLSLPSQFLIRFGRIGR